MAALCGSVSTVELRKSYERRQLRAPTFPAELISRLSFGRLLESREVDRALETTRLIRLRVVVAKADSNLCSAARDIEHPFH